MAEAVSSAKLPTGVPGFDAFLGGGLERRVITQFFGEGGSGKSTIALRAAVSALSKGTGVIYIDTEGFSAERFCQIAGDKAEEYAKSLYVYEPSSFAEQGQVISESERLLRPGKAGLLILDSATALYRVESGGKDAMARLSQQMMVLLGISRRFDIPVVITNQVFMDIDSHRLTGLGGTALFHISKVIVRIEKHEGFRRAVIVKHRSEAEGKSWDFVLTGDGIRGRTGEGVRHD
ncbi:MAG: DNA repair and recombination protein RadB [Methanocorpusculum sp.]|nr:DNA repair and recombination protein RadB [Methanocorpusculum sp.]